MEEEQPAQRGLAERDLHRLPVVGRLSGLVDRLRHRGLRAGVERLLRRRYLRLDSELVEVDRQSRAGLRGPVERLTEERHELRVVRERDRRRVRVHTDDRSDARVVLVGVQ